MATFAGCWNGATACNLWPDGCAMVLTVESGDTWHAIANTWYEIEDTTDQMAVGLSNANGGYLEIGGTIWLPYALYNGSAAVWVSSSCPPSNTPSVTPTVITTSIYGCGSIQAGNWSMEPSRWVCDNFGDSSNYSCA